MSAPAGLQPPALRRPGPVIDGLRADRPGARWRRGAARLLVSKAERDEAELERRLGQQPAVSRANVAAVVSPKGGVGKTTCSFVLGNLIADRLRLRVVAVDANRDFGTLASLVPPPVRCPRTPADLLADLDRIETATELRRYMSALPSGLQLLGAPDGAAVMAGLGADACGELVALLSTFYDVVLLDLVTGVAGPLAQFALRRADQAVIVTTPEWMAASAVLAALEHLAHERTTVACNMFHARRPAGLTELERRLGESGLHRSVAVPYDEQLAGMLDSATYQLDALRRPTRSAIKRLGLAVCEQLV